MILPPLHLPLISAGCFGAVVARMLDFLALRIRRSDQGMAPSLSPDLRAQTVALHRRLAVLTRAFHRLAELARQGRLRVYPDRISRAAREDGAERPPGAHDARPRAGATGFGAAGASPFGPPPNLAQGATLPPVPMRGFGWLLGLLPAAYAPAFAALLTNPEMASLIGASPSVARLLRPLCHGLGVTPPDGVFPPPRLARARRSRARPGRAAAHPGGTGDAARGSASACSRRAATAGEAARSGTVHARPPSAADAGLSPQARDRWWAKRRAAAPRGRCAKR